jgi:hypothetical protein
MKIVDDQKRRFFPSLRPGAGASLEDDNNVRRQTTLARRGRRWYIAT